MRGSCLFDVTDIAPASVEGRLERIALERIALEHLTLAPNPRIHTDADGIRRLARMLVETGQLVPCIGRRPNPKDRTVVLFDGHRRLLAARAGHRLPAPQASTGSPR